MIADSPKGDKDRTIVVGAHLDSVEAGPRASTTTAPGLPASSRSPSRSRSSTTSRATACASPSGAPRRPVSWARRPTSNEQVENGTDDQIEANLNFDMIGSPNFVRFVYDGDLSDSPPPPSGAPAGSGQIEQLFNRYFDRQGLAYEPTAFDGRSDYGPFITNGIAAGGLFTGAEVEKSAEQEEVFGGVTGAAAFDPCYHQACDTFFNLNHEALDQMSDAAGSRHVDVGALEEPARRPRGRPRRRRSKEAGQGLEVQGTASSFADRGTTLT